MIIASLPPTAAKPAGEPRHRQLKARVHAAGPASQGIRDEARERFHTRERHLASRRHCTRGERQQLRSVFRGRGCERPISSPNKVKSVPRLRAEVRGRFRQWSGQASQEGRTLKVRTQPIVAVRVEVQGGPISVEAYNEKFVIGIDVGC